MSIVPPTRGLLEDHVDKEFIHRRLHASRKLPILLIRSRLSLLEPALCAMET